MLFTLGAALMTFQPVRQYGVSLFASAGVAGIVAGLAARPVLCNLMAGVQLAMTQPIRLDDAVIVENEYGTIEEITSTYVVVRLWDWRRMIVPLTYFIEKPFQNWTRESSTLIGTVLHLCRLPRAGRRDPREAQRDRQAVEPLGRQRLQRSQVTDFKEDTMELRILASAATRRQVFDLRCEVREKLIDFLQREHPEALPQPGRSASRQRGFPSHRAEGAARSGRRRSSTCHVAAHLRRSRCGYGAQEFISAT